MTTALYKVHPSLRAVYRRHRKGVVEQKESQPSKTPSIFDGCDFKEPRFLS